MPCPPHDTSLPVYRIADGQFLVDETGGQILSGGNPQNLTSADYSAILQQQADQLEDFVAWIQQIQAQPQAQARSGPIMEPLDGGVPLVYGTNDLWLEILPLGANAFNADTNNATLLLHGTIPDVAYQLLSKPTLTDAVWTVEQNLIGAADANCTPAAVSMTNRPTIFFRALAYGLDSDGDGLPDWWQFRYFDHIGVDPYADLDGDGWSNIEEYQNGTNPLQFDTPPPPRIVSAHLDATGTNVVLVWKSGGGPVDHYGVEDDWGDEVAEADAGTFTLTASPFIDPDSRYGLDAYLTAYTVRAYYNNGNHQDSLPVSVADPGVLADVSILRGTLGQPYIVVANPPLNLSDIEPFWLVWDGHAKSLALDVTNLANGVGLFPAGQVNDGELPIFLDYRVVTGAGETSSLGTTFPYWAREEGSAFYFGFLNAQRYLKENLRLLLRAATISHPFSYISNKGTTPSNDTPWPDPTTGYYPDEYLSRLASSTNYEYYGFRFYGYQNSPSHDYLALNELRPVQDNYIWLNFVFDPTQWTDGYFLGTGADFDPADHLRMLTNPKYLYTGSRTNIPATAALTTENSTWLYDRWIDYDLSAFEDIGIQLDVNTNLFLNNNVRNCYGLPLLSVLAGTNELILPGNLVTGTNTAYFINFAVPELQTVDYYFASQDRHLWEQDVALPPMPGTPDFTVTNTSPLLVTAVGQPITVAGWAKQAILNGYPNKFAYLEQYFDQAYTMDTNGVATTNEAGILSPYGEFFPLQPGPAALVTMPDIDTGERGTGVVQVISLNVDANHDGRIDLAYTGSDQTTASRPYSFWVNNDYDANGLYGDPDFDVWAPQLPDYNYSDGIYGNGKPCIHSKRDLEDYARLWICGVPALTNGNYQVSMSWGSISSGNPKIHLFQSVETNGGTLYLTDTNVAAAQFAVQTYVPGSSNTFAYYIQGPGVSIGTVSNGAPFVFLSSYFTNSGNKYLLFEGAGIGAGQLTLTISQVTAQGTNVLAQTSTWLDLHDVKDFYEQTYATNVTSGKPPSSLISNFGVIQTAKSPAPDETKQIIIFVHGINNTETGYEISSATIFKRLYWSGYHGRFASFRWPCAYLPWNTANPFQYNKGEFYAFKSATALKNYLSYLRNNRPDLAGYDIDLYAHSQGNVVASEAILQGAPFDNYILTQGAFPAHCYDTNAPFLQKLLDAETNSVNAMQTPFYPVDGGYHGYCLPIQGNLVDFYNTNDYALATGTTGPLQTNWEEDQRAQKPEAFLGGPSYLYDASTHVTTGYYTFGSSYTVTDLQEIKALVARSRSRAVGAQAGLGGVIGSSVDLGSSAFGFGRTRTEHSAQFDRPIQTVWGYYDEVLLSFGIPLTVNR